uniref:Uncharacterized protein n=1 Tax=Erpetoichthys calabaricus TaxID=27687 RepID=A0A8C4RM04_ERPCA
PSPAHITQFWLAWSWTYLWLVWFIMLLCVLYVLRTPLKIQENLTAGKRQMSNHRTETHVCSVLGVE